MACYTRRPCRPWHCPAHARPSSRQGGHFLAISGLWLAFCPLWLDDYCRPLLKLNSYSSRFQGLLFYFSSSQIINVANFRKCFGRRWCGLFFNIHNSLPDFNTITVLLGSFTVCDPISQKKKKNTVFYIGFKEKHVCVFIATIARWRGRSANRFPKRARAFRDRSSAQDVGSIESTDTKNSPNQKESTISIEDETFKVQQLFFLFNKSIFFKS